MKNEVELLSTAEAAIYIGYKIDHFKHVIKHTERFKEFVNPVVAHQRAHPKYKKSELKRYLDSFGKEIAA
jgi:hypothetical protein